MKRLFFAILLTLPVVLPAIAQPVVDEQRYADSLVRLQQHGPDDSTKARASLLLSDFWSYSDTAQSRRYLQLGKQYAGDDAFLQAVYCFYEAGFIFDTDIDRALQLYAEAAGRFSRFHTKESYVFQARAWRNSGALYQRQNNLAEMANLILTRSVPLAEKAGERLLIAGYYTDVGMVFMNQDTYPKAAYYFEKSLAYYKTEKPPLHSELTTLILAADNYIYMDSLALAKPLMDRVAVLLEPFPDSEYNLDYFTTASKYYRQTKALEQSLQHTVRGIALAQKLNKPYKRSELRFQQYKVYADQGRYALAQQTLQQVIDETPVKLDNNRLIYYKNMSDTYEKMGNIPKAHEWLKKFTAVRDSVYPERLKSEVAAIETKYNAAEKEKRIIQLQAEKQDALLKQKNQRLMNWLLGIAGLLLLVATVSLIVFYRISKKQARQKLTEIERRQELKVTNALLEGAEKERRRVARDLHDGLGGALAGIRLKLSGHQKKQQNAGLGEVIVQLEDSMTELRRIAHNMMPESLLKLGLETALTDLCDALTGGETDIEFQPSGIRKDLPQTAQANIYRIVQEILSNAIRHSGASSIILQCIQNDRRFFITAEDNGRGFDTATAPAGIGLTSIRDRVRYMKGRIDIESAPGEGTTINIELYV